MTSSFTFINNIVSNNLFIPTIFPTYSFMNIKKYVFLYNLSETYYYVENINISLYAYIIYIYILIFFSKINKFNLFKFSEKELSSLDDLLNIIFLLFCLLFNVVYSNILLLNNIASFTTFLFIFKSMLFILFLNILLFLYNCGFYFISFIKGSSQKQIISYEFVYDLINLVSYFLRWLIQVVRIFIIIVLYYTFYHSLVEYIYYYNIIDINLNSNFNNVFFQYIWILFEYIHMFLLFLIQILSFLVMLFWLFQFLFTAFSSKTMEVCNF